MNRRIFLTSALGFCFLSSVLAKDHGKGKGKGKNKGDWDDDAGPGRGHPRYFRQEDYAPLRRYYAGPRDLPPGLRKKYYRTGTLPRGWQKKIRPVPPELVRVLPPPPPYCEFGYVDGVAVVYDRRTRIIVDAIDIVNALSGR